MNMLNIYEPTFNGNTTFLNKMCQKKFTRKVIKIFPDRK